MTMSIYTNQLTSSGSDKEITSADIVMLNGNNIVHSIDAEYNGINPIPSFDVVKSMSVDLSGKLSVIDKELSAHDAKLSSHMQYYGAFSIYETDITKLSTWLLSSFLDKNLNVDSTYVIDKGTMFKFLSSVSLSDSANVSIELFNNDYIVANTDVIVGQAMISSFDVIRDAQVEVEKFHDEIYNALCETSSILTNDITSTSVFLSGSISSVSDDLNTISNKLSTAISSKIFIDDRISGLSGCNDLSIIKLSADEYAALLSTGQVVSNCIYIVENPFKNMYGQQIKNLAPGTNLSDAVNLGQLISVSNAIPVNVSQLSNDKNYLMSSDLSNYCYLSSQTSSAQEISDALTSVNSQLTNYLPLTGGTLTGNLSIVNGSIINGTSSIADGINSFAFGEHTSAIGDNSYAVGTKTIAGAKGWYYKAVDTTNKRIYLTKTQQTSVLFGNDIGDISAETGFDVPSSVISNTICLVDDNKDDFGTTKVSDIISGTVLTYEDELKNVSCVSVANLNYDDYSVMIPEVPDAGIVVVSKNSFAQGNSTSAIGPEGHAEGKNTYVQGNYSHAEGRNTKALAYVTHAEGINTVAGKNGTEGRYSHTEGKNTKTEGEASHAEGLSSIASSAGSHAEGKNTKTEGEASHAEGFQANASGNYAHAEGYQTSAIGNESHAEGTLTFAKGSGSHTEGQKTYAMGDYSHAEGNATSAMQQYAHAEGNTTQALGKTSHAEGYQTITSGDVSYSSGIYSKAIEHHTWCWNGDATLSISGYMSHGQGTFNINPRNGLSGFYIGENSLCSILSDYSTNDAVTDLKNNIASSISGITQISIDNNSDLSNIISACITMRDLISSLYTAIKQ